MKATEVVVIGGGMAGCMAALMLQRRGIEVTVLESRERDQPQKIVVGEAITEGSTVFFRHEIGFGDWLDEHGFRKFGFDFVVQPRHSTAPEEPTIEDCHELLMSLVPFEEIPAAFRKLIPTYHVDRPAMNAELARRTEAAGADVHYGAKVRSVDFGDDTHTVHYRQDGEDHTVPCRWVYDCSGWRSILGKQVGAWKRVDALPTACVWNRFAGVEDSREHWASFGGIDRRRQTIHFGGEGFWIWWIHQNDGTTSVGVTYDTRQHSPDRSTPDRGFWELVHRIPAVRKALKGAQELETFQTYGHLPHGCDHWISPRGYALIGDASWFVDALYSTAIETVCRQLMASLPLVQSALKAERPCEVSLSKLNQEFRYLQRAALAHNRFKYEHAWHRPHALFQVTLYELSEIAELYHLQDGRAWTRDRLDKHYRLQWGSLKRCEALETFMEQSLADADRDLGSPKLLRKALSPTARVYWSTLPCWHLPGMTPYFFTLTKWWGYAERMAHRHALWPDLLSLLTPPRALPMTDARG